jgi:hypothetical protein
MYKSDFDVDGLSMDALMAILSGKRWDYAQLKKKLESLKRWKNMNSGEIGGAFIWKSKQKVHYAQTQEEISRMMEECEH